MAFDVYVGTFTRYYTLNWENVAQQQARLEGKEYHVVYSGGDPGPPPDPKEVRETVDIWKQSINTSIAQHGCAPIEWSEDDEQPYFTDRPGWPGFRGLLLWASYAQFPELTPPYELPQNWFEDPAFQRAAALDEENMYSSILLANIWLPGEFLFRFEFPDLAEDEQASISSCSCLLAQLGALKDSEQKWSKPDGGGKSKKSSGEISLTLKEAAHIGHSVFTEMAERAVEHHLPLLLSY